jgi:hypothetical protein
VTFVRHSPYSSFSVWSGSVSAHSIGAETFRLIRPCSGKVDGFRKGATHPTRSIHPTRSAYQLCKQRLSCVSTQFSCCDNRLCAAISLFI